MQSKLLLILVLITFTGMFVFAEVPTTLEDFFLPGSQPGQSGNLEHPSKCDNCHGGYNQAVEPAFNWRGSMMAQAARDPLFYACLAIANQDAPESGDLCIRCHSPAGWLEGRSSPTDGSALNNNDREGVQCDFCHKLVKPMAINENPFINDADYAADTWPEDQSYLGTLSIIPPHSANGMYIADNSNAKRGPFVDAEARHQMFYSPFHQEAALCGTCHDVSNPVYAYNSTSGEYEPNADGLPAPSFNLRDMFPIERTYSEWMVSAFNSAQGVYAPQFGGNLQNVRTCQDCHMRDVSGVACNKRGAIVREDLPLHDLTGGNTFIPGLLEALFPGETSQTALQAGVQRATEMLQKAASLNVTVSGTNVTVTVTNETGHKLPSGYPEGRRIWINLKAFDSSGDIFYESGAYDFDTAELTHDPGLKVYEIKPGISTNIAGIVNLPAEPSFHFAINNKIYKDNRIPPKGYTYANFEAIQSPPVTNGNPDGAMYTDNQNFDVTEYDLGGEPARVDVTLYYQTVSKDYVVFLRDENVTNDWGNRFYDLWSSNGKSAPVVMASESIILGSIVDTEAPTAPSNLTARAASSSEIDLSWTASTDNIGVTGYEIYRNDVSAAMVAGTSYPDQNLSPETTYSYYVIAYDAAGNTSLPSQTVSATTKRQKGGGKPGKNSLALSGPNPFNPQTRLTYQLAEAASVSIDVYTVTGQHIATLVNSARPAGTYNVVFNADNVASGIYIVRMRVGQELFHQRLVVMK